MPVQVDVPIAFGSPPYTPGLSGIWKLWGAASSKVQAVSTNDGDTSIVYASTGGQLIKDQYIFPPLSGMADPVTAASVTIVTRRLKQGGGGENYHFRWNGAQKGNNLYPLFGRPRGPNFWVTTTYSAGAATLAAVNGEHGMQFNAAGGPTQKTEVAVTHLYRTVDFTYDEGSAEGFAHLIGSLAAAVIGSGLLAREMSSLARHIWSQGRVLLRPDEYEKAWRVWCEYTHPRFVFLGAA